MGNLFATSMLLIWPAVMVVLFRRLPVERALIWSIIGGYLLLPPVTEINLPMVPAMNKLSIPALTAWLICTLSLGHRVPLLPESVAGRLLVVLFLLSPLGTALTNGDPLILPGAWVPGLSLYDGVSMAAVKFFVLLVWALGRRYLRTTAALRELLAGLMLGGLIYSLPMLVEVRMSPQMNVWIYGFFQHSFDQMVRWGGYRPIVFLEHGLWVAFYALMAFVAAAVLAREAEAPARQRLVAATVWLGIMLVLCKTMGVLVYAAVLVPLVLFAGGRLMLWLAAAMAVFALAYPLLRGAGQVPVDELVQMAEYFSADRAGSLGYRFEHEAILLDHAAARPLFGWGQYMRNLVLDPFTGRPVTVSDGAWIIVLGTQGWAGYLGEFGLLGLPLLLLVRLARRAQQEGAALVLGALAVLHGANLVDLIPNATVTPVTWLVAGALLGRVEELRLPARAAASPAVARPLADTRPRTIL